MTEKQRALWEAIRRFSFDETIEEYGFETRLAYENKWTHHVTKQAIEEYKKFMFLASISNQMVSPSEIVDRVWHQHLIFSKSYERLCQIAGRKIEHIPSTHNPHNHSVFNTAKEHTATLYESYFGQQDPHFWDNHYLDATQLTTKDTVLRKRLIQIGCVSVLLYLPLYFLLKPFIAMVESEVFILYTVLLQLTLLVILKFQIERITDNQAGKLCNEDMHFQNLNASEIICLKNGNNNRFIHAAVDNMIKKGVLKTEGNWGIKPLNARYNSKEEIAIGNSLSGNEPVKYVDLFWQLRQKELFQIPKQVMDNLEKSWINSSRFVWFFSVVIATLLPLLYVLLIRLQLGLQKSKPVFFLLVETALYVFAGYYLLLKARNSLFSKAIPNFYNTKIKNNERDDLKESWEWKYLVLDSAFYSDKFHQIVSPIETKANSKFSWSSSGSGCSSGCGSSCGSNCGGGCGGCGGGD